VGLHSAVLVALVSKGGTPHRPAGRPGTERTDSEHQSGARRKAREAAGALRSGSIRAGFTSTAKSTMSQLPKAVGKPGKALRTAPNSGGSSSSSGTGGRVVRTIAPGGAAAASVATTQLRDRTAHAEDGAEEQSASTDPIQSPAEQPAEDSSDDDKGDADEQQQENGNVMVSRELLEQLLRKAARHGAREALQQRRVAGPTVVRTVRSSAAAAAAEPTLESGQMLDANEGGEKSVHKAAKGVRELVYATAGQEGVLASWLFELRRARMLHGIDSEAARMRLAEARWDEPMARWWAGHERARRDAEEPALTWEQVEQLLRTTFRPTGDERAAYTKLLAVRMQGGEGMDAYLLRVDELRGRAGARAAQEDAIVHQSMQGVDASRFPFTLLAVRRRVQEAEDAGEPMGFHAVRALLMAEAHHEPAVQRSAPAAAMGSKGNHHKQHTGAGSGEAAKQLRVAALRQELAALEQTAGPALTVAPLHTQSSGCRKCGKDGHQSWECTSATDRRTCFSCGQAGHIKPNCPDRAAKASAAAAAEARAEGSAAGSDASKNA
jgi:hypothetical protein